MLYFAVIGVLESFLKLGAALLVVHVLADKLILYGALMAGISILSMTAMLVYCRRNYAECVIAPLRYWKRGVFREMGSFAGWNFTVSASSMLSEYGVGIVLNHFFGVALNAAQAVAQQINGQTMAFSGTMLKALNPVISKSEGAGNRGLMLRASLSGCKFAYLLMAVFAIPLILEAPGLLGLWLHSVPAWAVLFCRLQLARTLLEQLFLSLGSAIYAEGNIRLYTLVKTGSGILFLGATWGFYRMGWPPLHDVCGRHSLRNPAGGGFWPFSFACAALASACGIFLSGCWRRALFPARLRLPRAFSCHGLMRLFHLFRYCSAPARSWSSFSFSSGFFLWTAGSAAPLFFS